MAINLGQLPETVRKIRVVDPVDPRSAAAGRAWCYDLPEQYRQRYGETCWPSAGACSSAMSTATAKCARQFWALVADLVAERYFGQIQTGVPTHRIASSGHILCEEACCTMCRWKATA